MITNQEMLELLRQGQWSEVIDCVARYEWKPDMPVATDGFSFRLLECFAERADVGSVARLVAAGASVNARVRGGDTALMIAAVRGDAALVGLLLEAGASTELKSRGQTALMRAAECFHEPIIRKLLAAGASVSAKTSNGMTALSHALLVRKPHERIVALHLDAGCPVDGRDLHSPVAMREAQVVKTLLPKTHDVNVRFDWNTAGSDIQKGDTPLLVAVASTGIEIWKAVGAKFGETKPAERLAIVEMLLQAGADVNVQRRRGGATPLLLAAAQDNLEIAERLIGGGADPEQEFACELIKFPFSKPKTAYPRTISAVGMARMSPRNKKIRRLLLGTE